MTNSPPPIDLVPLARRPKAILFDNDGVLIESESLHMAAWAKMLSQYQIPASISELEALVGRTAPQIMRTFLDRYRPGWSSSEFNLDEIALRKNDLYLEEVRTHLKLYPGVREGLEQFRAAGIQMAIVTNAKRRELEASLDALGTREFFSTLISRDDVSEPKPSPMPYLTAAAVCGVELFEALVVEDSPPGLEAGLMSGIPTVGMLSNFDESQLQSPVPGRPDLKPIALHSDMRTFVKWVLDATA